MKSIVLAAVASLMAGAAYAQTTPGASTTMPPSATGTTTGAARPAVPGTTTTGAATMGTSATGTGTSGITTAPTATSTVGTARTGAATGTTTDHNPAVATNSANAPQPAHGSNSFTAGEAQGRITRQGFSNVSGLKKDTDGVWRGQAQKAGQSVAVWLDYKGNVGQN